MLKGGYQLRRLSDHSVLPVTFSGEDLRRRHQYRADGNTPRGLACASCQNGGRGHMEVPHHGASGLPSSDTSPR
jgi:hypothetical protein